MATAAATTATATATKTMAGAQQRTLSWQPVHISTLVSKRDPAFRIAHEDQAGRGRTLLLAYQRADGALQSAAILSSLHSEGRQHVAIRRLPHPPGQDGAMLDVLTLEHLFAWSLRQDPAGRFCMVRGPKPCSTALAGTSLAGLLESLARERAAAVARAGPALSARPWRVVSVARAPTPTQDDDEVSARISLNGRPLAGVNLYFNRPPHSSCSGESDADGVATCRLVDQHGDEASHDHDENAPVSATFPGDVRADRTIVPTTVVLEKAP